VRLEVLDQLKKSNDLIGNRTRDLPACSKVPQLTRYRVLPESLLYEGKIRTNTNKSTVKIFTKETSTQKQAAIRTKNSVVVRRNKIFGHTPRKELEVESTH
jgi:hypothetical protein